MKRMTDLLAAVALTVGLSLMVGCVETAGTTIQTDHLTGNTLIFEGSTRMRDQLRVVKSSYDEVNGLKRVQVLLESTKHKRLRFQYRISWFDANGMELDPGTKTYRALLMEGRDSVMVSGIANSPAGITSKVRVREADAAD